MNLQTLKNQISNIDRDIDRLDKSIQTIDTNISRKTKEANNILSKISREKDLKRVIKLKDDLNRKNEEISRLEKQKNPKSKSLSEKRKKKLELQEKLYKEEQKERDKAKKEQKELLSIQQKITREMQQQKNMSLNAMEELPQERKDEENYDVFISHASEDKDVFVRPLANALIESGLKVWYDEFELDIGSSLRRSIEKGLRNSDFGIVVLSNAFFNKEWPQRELDALFQKEINGKRVILPIWHKITKDEVMNFSPIIADLLALNTSNFTVEEIAQKISEKVNKQNNQSN